MNNPAAGAPAVISYRRVIAALLAVLLTLLVGVDFVLIRRQGLEYRRDMEDRIQHQLDVAATFMIDPLLKYQLTEVTRYMQELFDNYTEILSLEATTPSGHVLKSLKRPVASSQLITRQKEVVYQGRHLLTLALTRDFSGTEASLRGMRNQLLGISLGITLLLGLMLWLVFRRFALQPLEGEINRRQEAERRLADVNAGLEARIRKRTRELVEMNTHLSEEIRQRSATEHNLATEKERLAVTLRSIGDGVITTDLAARVVFMNQVAELLTGWTQEDAAGRPLAEVFSIIDEKDGRPRENPVDTVLQTERIVELAEHTTLIARDGRRRSIADSAAPIRDADNRIMGVVLVFRDISDKARMENEIQKMRKLEAVGLLAGGIAHDFNNLLVGIVGNLSLARELVSSEDHIHPLLRGAEKASLRAAELTQQLLTFAKGGDPVRETDSIEEIIRESTSFILRGGNVACSFDFAEGLWLVDVDRSQMSQVLQNIILNARQAMPAGGNIRISGENVADFAPPGDRGKGTGKYVRIRIQDTGGGIPPKYLDRIFDPYFTTKKEGSGLGLAICHSIIRKHDGSITVESKQGEGTTFIIHLPASAAKIRETPAAEKVTQAHPSTILVMDDEETVLQVVDAMLSHLGHKVITAQNGTEAVALYQEDRQSRAAIDLLIMDLTIPGGMGGLDAVREILAINPLAKVVVSSGYSNDPVMARYRDYGFCAAISKPYQLEALMATVNSVLA